MRICCIMTTVGYSGAPKMMAWLANSLAEIGHSVSLISFYNDKDHQKLCGVKRVPLNIDRSAKTKLGKLYKLCLTELELLRAIKKENPELVLAFSNLPSGLFLLLKKLHGRRVIISERSDPYLEVTSAMNWIRKQYPRADGVVFQTEGAKAYFEGHGLKKTTVIPNPVTAIPLDRTDWHKRTNDIVFVGRFNMRQKRQDIMLEAFEKVAALYPDITLTFYGDGEDMEQVRQLTKKKKIDRRVHFAGQVDNICQIIKNARLYVITSDFEGIPNSLIDAMTAGLPVVATDCSPGGARLLIQDRENGLIVPKGDADAVADAIFYMLEHPEEADKMGSNARYIVSKFSPKKIAYKWNEFLSD